MTGYHQVPMAETAFLTLKGVLYQYTSMPVGFGNAPVTFERIAGIAKDG